jgi:ABC-2 type transport system permease protein
MTGYVRLELRRMLRTPAFLIFTVVMPLVMYLVFTNLGTLTGQSHQQAALYAMVSVGGYGAIGALLNYSSGVVGDRTIGWLRQLRLTPLSPAKVVLGKSLTGMVLALPPIVVMCAAAALVNGVRLPATQWVTVVALLWAGATPFVLLGLGIGYLCTTQTVQPANFLAYFGMSLVGGLWLPLAVFPHALRTVGGLMPTHAYADLAWRVVFGSPASTGDVVILGAWLVAFVGFAVFAYRRSAATR